MVLKSSLIKLIEAKASNFLVSGVFKMVCLMFSSPAKPLLLPLSIFENRLRSLTLPATSNAIVVFSVGWYAPFTPPTCIFVGGVS